MIEKIISGGQTGVDQAALEVAIKLNISQGGWCPKGRLSENGVIPSKYFLTETESDKYSERTKLNVRDSDGTLILIPRGNKNIMDGTVLTIQEAKEQKKPYLIVDPENNTDIESIVRWIFENKIKILNVAGPRESKSPGINKSSLEFLQNVIGAILSNTYENP